MMLLWSSYSTERRSDAYFAAIAANTIGVRCLRL